MVGTLRVTEINETQHNDNLVAGGGAITLSGIVTVSGGIGRPQRQVVAEQLHDERAVLVRVLVERIKLGDGIVERLLGKLARAIGGVLQRWNIINGLRNQRAHISGANTHLDLVVEHGVVERESQSDWVGWLHVRLGDLVSLRVCGLR